MNPGDFIKAANRLMELGKFEEAESCYTELILAGHEQVELYNNRGSARFALAKYEKASRDYSQAIQLNPRIDYPHFNRANCKVQLGDLEGAIRDYDRALQFNPTHADSYLNRAVCWQKKAQHTAALKDFGEAVSHASTLAGEVSILRSDSYFALGETKKAFEALEQALEHKPKDQALLLRLIDLYLEAENHAEALRVCQRGLAQFGNPEELRLKRAEIYVEAGAPALAWTDLEGLDEKLVNKNKQYYFIQGKVLAALGRKQEAVQRFEEGLALDGEQIEAWVMLAGLYLKQGNYEATLQAIDKAKELDRDFEAPYLLGARALFEMGKNFAALAEVERYEKRGGILTAADLLKGFIYLDLDRLAPAQKAFEIAVEKNPELPDAFLGLGNVAMLNSQYANALHAFDKAIELVPDFRAAWFNKGMALKHLGKISLALQSWEQAARFYHPEAEAYLCKYRDTPNV